MYPFGMSPLCLNHLLAHCKSYMLNMEVPTGTLIILGLKCCQYMFAVHAFYNHLGELVHVHDTALFNLLPSLLSILLWFPFPLFILTNIINLSSCLWFINLSSCSCSLRLLGPCTWHTFAYFPTPLPHNLHEIHPPASFSPSWIFPLVCTVPYSNDTWYSSLCVSVISLNMVFSKCTHLPTNVSNFPTNVSNLPFFKLSSIVTHRHHNCFIQSSAGW